MESWKTSLMEAARKAAERAYCPYSQFPVGAALRTRKGDVVTGCNVENRSYGLTICAERNAVFQAVDKGQKEFDALALYTPTSDPVMPCGACLQVLSEFNQTMIVLIGFQEGIVEKKLNELFPASFDHTPPGMVSYSCS
ncbi:MAG TPA: cytidine deaminase [bacterium]|nr:cytidine deaminase [bacterium]